MLATINKTLTGYQLTCNGISVNFKRLYNLVKYARCMKFQLQHEI